MDLGCLGGLDKEFYGISLIMAFILFILWLAFIWIPTWLAFYSHQTSNEESKFGEFFNGLKSMKRFKFYTVILISRRTIFIVVLICLVSTSSILVISILSILQLIYLLYLVILRPFWEIKCNIIEIINEIWFSSLIIYLLYFNTEKRWTSLPISIYIWLIASNNISIFLIVLSNHSFHLYSWFNKIAHNKNQESLF